MDRKPEQSAQSLPVTELMEIERVCCQFEAAWKAGRQPKVEDYLADSAEPRRSELRRELEAIDAEYRRPAKAAPVGGVRAAVARQRRTSCPPPRTILPAGPWDDM